MNAISAFTGSHTKTPFGLRIFHLWQIRILRRDQPIVNVDSADTCCLCITKMKALNFQEDIPSIPIDNFKDHYVLILDLTSKQDATENCHYHEWLENHWSWTEFLVFLWNTLLNSLSWENECLRLQLTSLTLLEEISKLDSISRQQIFNRIPLLKYQHPGSSPSDYVPTLDNDTFVIINTQPSNMQGEFWIMTANSCQNLYFCRLFWSEKVQFAQTAVWIDVARTTTVPSQRLQFLHGFCSFSFFQIPTRRIYWGSRC